MVVVLLQDYPRGTSGGSATAQVDGSCFGCGSAGQEAEAQRQRDEARALAEKLQAALEELRRTTYTAQMNLAQHAWGRLVVSEHPVNLPREKKYEGKYLIQTDQVDMTPEKAVEHYKDLSEVERGFRSLKDPLGMRPIWHRDARLLARFQREARAAAQLHHTNIVPVFEVGQEGPPAPIPRPNARS